MHDGPHHSVAKVIQLYCHLRLFGHCTDSNLTNNNVAGSFAASSQQVGLTRQRKVP